MRILLLTGLPICRNWGEELWRQELRRQEGVTHHHIGVKREGMDAYKAWVDHEEPEVVLVSYDETRWENFDKIPAFKVHRSGDFYPFSTVLHRFDGYFEALKFNLGLGYTRTIVNNMRLANIPAVHLYPFGVSTGHYKNLDLPKTHDISTLYSTDKHNYPERWYIRNFLNTLPEVNHYGPDRNKHRKQDYIEVINQSKISVSNNHIHRFLQPRVLEIMACGTLCFSDHFYDNERLRLQHEKHLIYYSDLHDLCDKAQYYLAHTEKREQIAQAGMDYVRRWHSDKMRIQELYDILEGEIK